MEKNCECAGVDLMLYSGIVSTIISKNLTPSQINILANFIQSIGQNLALIAATKESFNS